MSEELRWLLIETGPFWAIVITIIFMKIHLLLQEAKAKENREQDAGKAFVNLPENDKPKTGMEKIKELKNRLGNLAMTDDRPAVWRICRSLVEALDEVQKEHEDELEEVRVIARGLQARGDECENKCQEAEAKVTELQGQLRAMSDRANSAMADAQKWQNAYLNLRVETPIVQKTDATWYMNDQPVSEPSVFAQQAYTAMKAQEERTPRNGYHKYHIKFYSYKNQQWHETNLWCGGIKDVEDWVLGACGGDIPVYDCKVIA